MLAHFTNQTKAPARHVFISQTAVTQKQNRKHANKLFKHIICITIIVLVIIDDPVFYLKTQRIGDWILSKSSGGKYLDVSNSKS
jgi:hypothetical protein